MNRWNESDALDPIFEKSRKAQVVRIKIEAVSLDSTSMAPSLDGSHLASARSPLKLSRLGCRRGAPQIKVGQGLINRRTRAALQEGCRGRGTGR
jgi:hypothetical protein